jgi:hypothetical protein
MCLHNSAPQFERAVRGQTGAQRQGAFFNTINRFGNVIAPVGAVGAVVGGIVSYAAAYLRSRLNRSETRSQLMTLWNAAT